MPFPVHFPAFLKAIHPELLIICIFPDIAEIFKYSLPKLFSELYYELVLLFLTLKIKLEVIIGEKAKRIPKVIKTIIFEFTLGFIFFSP